MRRHWLYKNNTSGGPAGYWGDWDGMVFNSPGERRWGGHFATRSPQVGALLDEAVTAGDVVIAYQTDTRSVIGFCVISEVKGRRGDRELYLEPIERLTPPFPMHDRKVGTTLEKSWAVRGPVMLAELTTTEMQDLVRLSGAPSASCAADRSPVATRASRE